TSGCGSASASGDEATKGTQDNPLVVMLVPSETGSTSVRDDYDPLFNAISRVHGIEFDMKTGDSYNAVVEAMAAGHIDVAFFGLVSFNEARKRGGVELLAVEEKNGVSEYFSGIFARADAGMSGIQDLRGKKIALGDPLSTSSFNIPVAMIMDAGIDPVKDLGGILIAGSHSASLEALEAGQVDAAAASLNAYTKMVDQGTVDPEKVVLLVKSDPIPSPPIAVRNGLDADVKAKLKEAMATIHLQEGVTPEMILGYGSKPIDRYNTEFPVATLDKALDRLELVTDEVKDEITQFAGNR
ncbi:MAG: phosphate/phosphite/phosphonate ABC transporter substrate-binding protein, partial [Rhodospirillales bacterium]|nr:phosphate/phosphite/phosphonate ABC transporter substrate-binding protein [Rhodospirillales bacterium]